MKKKLTGLFAFAFVFGLATTGWSYSFGDITKLTGFKDNNEYKQYVEEGEDGSNDYTVANTYNGIKYLGSFQLATGQTGNANPAPYETWYDSLIINTQGTGDPLFVKITEPKVSFSAAGTDDNGTYNFNDNAGSQGTWEWNFRVDDTPEFMTAKAGSDVFTLWGITASFDWNDSSTWGGDWTTEGLTPTGDTLKDISNISFYNTTSAPVPEPATVLLLGFGLVGLATVGRRRMKKQ